MGNDDNTNTRNARNEQTRNSKGTSTGGSSRASGLNSETSTETNNTEIYTETKINDRENNEREAADVSIKKTRSIVAIKLISHRQSAESFTAKFLEREVD